MHNVRCHVPHLSHVGLLSTWQAPAQPRRAHAWQARGPIRCRRSSGHRQRCTPVGRPQQTAKKNTHSAIFATLIHQAFRTGGAWMGAGQARHVRQTARRQTRRYLLFSVKQTAHRSMLTIGLVHHPRMPWSQGRRLGGTELVHCKAGSGEAGLTAVSGLATCLPVGRAPLSLHRIRNYYYAMKCHVHNNTRPRKPPVISHRLRDWHCQAGGCGALEPAGTHPGTPVGARSPQ